MLKDWQLKAMQVVWSTPKGANSRTVHQKVNLMLNGETISRASIINFLEVQRVMGVLRDEEKSGKGGYHWVYFPKMDERDFKKFIVEKMITSLMENFPTETGNALNNLK